MAAALPLGCDDIFGSTEGKELSLPDLHKNVLPVVERYKKLWTGHWKRDPYRKKLI